MLDGIIKKAKLRQYEGMFLLDNREVKKGWEHGKNLVLSVLERRKIEVQSSRRWDERRLAFEIKGQKRATFLLVYFQTDPAVIAELNDELLLTAGVLRHLILVLDKYPEKAFEPVDDDVDVSKIVLDDEVPAETDDGKEDKDDDVIGEGDNQDAGDAQGDESSDGDGSEVKDEVVETAPEETQEPAAEEKKEEE